MADPMVLLNDFAIAGDLNMINMLLDAGSDVNETDDDVSTTHAITLPCQGWLS